MNKYDRLVKNTVIYFLANFASKLLGILLIPIYTIYILPKNMGYYDLLLTLVTISTPVMTLQVVDAAYRYLLDSSDENENRSIITNSFGITVIGSVIFSFIYMLVWKLLQFKYGFLCLGNIIATALFGIIHQSIRGLKRNEAFALAGIIMTVVMFISNLVFIYRFKMQSDAIILSNIIASIFGIVYIELHVGYFKYIDFKSIDKRLMKKMISYSAPLIPSVLNWWIIISISRILLSFFRGVQDVGILALANRFPALLTMINGIFYLAWQESAITEYTNKDRDVFYSKMFNTFLNLQISIVTLLIPLTKIVIFYFIGINYKESWIYIPPLYIGAIFSAFASFYGTGYLCAKKTAGAFSSNVYSAILSVILNLVFIPVIGIHAVVFSNMLAFLLMWIVRIHQTKAFFNIKIDYQSIMPLVLLLLSSTILYYLLNEKLMFLLVVSFMPILLYINRNFLNRLYGIVKNILRSY